MKQRAFFGRKLYELVEGGEKIFLTLKRKLEVLGHKLTTIDQYPLQSFEKFVFMDFPSDNIELLTSLSRQKKDLFLVLLESEIVKPDNWQVANFRFFKKIFGWKPLQFPGYQRLLIAQNLEGCYSTVSFSDRKLACLIASNKYSDDHRELYSQRRKVIRWLEANAPDSFSLYGKGWQHGERTQRAGVLNRMIHCYFADSRPYPSYRGIALKKRALLGNFKFNFCFENVTGIDGYITEKIFDSSAFRRRSNLLGRA